VTSMAKSKYCHCW